MKWLPWLQWGAVLGGSALIVLVACWTWASPRFSFYVDDGANHALRLYVFDHLLHRGALFPRWWPDLRFGYGYPLSNFYAPGTYYLGELFRLVGLSNYRSIQATGVLAVLVGAGGSLALGMAVFGSRAAGVAIAGAYVLSPYPFITNLYNRTALPEVLGQGMLPWVLAAGWLAVQRPGAAGVLALGVSLAAAVLAHNLTALVAAAVLVPWLLAALLALPVTARRAAAQRAVTGGVLGLALSAFFWMPALVEKGAIHTELGNAGQLNAEVWLYDPLRGAQQFIEMLVPELYRVTDGAPFDLHLAYPHASHALAGPAKPSLAQVVFLALSGVAAAVGYCSASPRRPWHLAAPGAPPVPSALTGPGYPDLPSAPGLPTSRSALTAPAPPGLPVASELVSAAGPTRPRSDASPATLWSALAVALLVALGAWFMNLSWSVFLWRAVAPLQLLQFPWRLWGVFSLLVAVAGTGLFVGLARRGQPQWVLLFTLVGFVGVNGVYDRPGSTRMGDPQALPPLAEQLRRMEGESLAGGTLSGGEFLPRSVIFPEGADFYSGGVDTYERAFPSAGWIAGRVWPYSGTLSIQAVAESPTATSAQVEAGPDGGRLAFRTLVFPGWRAYVDGLPAPLETPPLDPVGRIGYGFAIVPVPPGTHRVVLAFTPTAVRMFSEAVSVAALGAVLALLGTVLRRRAAGSRWANVVMAVAVLVAGSHAAPGVVALWRPPPFLRLQTALVLDVTGALAARQVEVASPSGTSRGVDSSGFVSIRSLTIGSHTRPWLYMHPTSELRIPLHVPARAIFQTGVALDPETWERAGADGVRFVVEVVDRAGARRTLLARAVQPQTVMDDRGWRFIEIDLGQFAGQDVTLVLRTEGLDTPDFDWAGWGTPVVYVDRSARYPPPPALSAALRR